MEAIVYITLHVFLYLVPTEPPDNIDANIFETLVETSWDPVPKESRNGKILGYRITYYQEGNKTESKESEKLPHNFFSVQLKSLGKFSKYHFKILAYTGAGDGKVGSISFTTSDDSKYQHRNFPCYIFRSVRLSFFLGEYRFQRSSQTD